MENTETTGGIRRRERKSGECGFSEVIGVGVEIQVDAVLGVAK